MALETKNKNLLLNVIIIAVACFIAFNFIYKNQEQELQGLVAKKDVEIKKNAVLENIGRLEKKIDDYKTLLPKRDVGETINTINNLARGAAIKIVSIRPLAAEERTANYVKSSFEISLSASSYHALGKFISNLESYQDVYIVESADIVSQEAGKELTANLKVSAIAVKE